MSYKTGILGLLAIILLAGCKKEWDQYYNSNPPTVDENVWDAIKKDPNLSSFVQYMEEKQFDTLFESNNTYTLFVPDNESFSGLPACRFNYQDGIGLPSFGTFYTIRDHRRENQSTNPF